MSTLTFESARFGTVEIAADAVIEFPSGLIGLGGSRYALVSADADGAFHWLHSLEDAALALPVTNPWLFFGDYEVRVHPGPDGSTIQLRSSRCVITSGQARWRGVAVAHLRPSVAARIAV